jgi:3-isopropylmalate/(R)-2-methylmalate dehydratase large subunit
MQQTIAEKILSRTVGRPVFAGDYIEPCPDLVVVHDWYAATLGRVLESLQVQEFAEPEKVMFVTDHEPLATTPESSIRQKKVRELARKFRIGQFYDVGRGGLGHVFPVEQGMIRPGMYVAAYDTHVPNYGAVGALGFPFVTEIADVLTFGSVWVRAPQTVRVHLTGRLPPWVSIRDLAQRIIADLDPEIVDYSVVEFAGPGLQHVPIDGRLTLCNTPLEIGAKSAIVTPDQVTATYLEERCDGTVALIASDPGARFAHETSYDLGEITPQIALPPTPDNVRPLSAVAGTRIDHAFIGSCASGTLSDLRDAAAVLRSRKVHRDVRLFVTPASYGILAAAAKEGILAVFAEAGAILTPPGCGPCAAGRIAPLAPGETSINTGTRNDFGRLGPTDATIYLASPATVACSAIAGHIADPRDMMANSS